MRAVAAVVCLVAAFAATGAVAAATEASELSCSPSRVLPGQNMTCSIRGRDPTHETTRANPSDFLVRVNAQAEVAVSPIRATEDETLVVFTVSSAHGTHLNVEVTARNGMPIRGSGFQALVYASPPTALGELTCDATELTLRQSMTCTVPATGENGVPALVAQRDVFFSEDHGDGAFDMVRGDGAFVFTFTAPNSPSTKYRAFTIRVALSGSLSDPRNVSVPVRFPVEPPTTRSTLVCTDSDFSHCTINAGNTGGPVAFTLNDFRVWFEQDTSGMDSTPQWQPTNAMVAQWLPATTAQMPSVGNLRVDQRERNAVFRVRTHVVLAASGEEISGSPHAFTSGVAPTANDVTFRRCRQSYIVAGRSTTCYLLVGNGASAAPRFMAADIAEGAGELGELTYVNGSETGVPGLENARVVQFNFTAPEDIDERMDVLLAVTVQGAEAVRSPLRLVVFPRSVGNEVERARNERPPVIAVGLIFFGTVCILGLAAFFRRNARLRRVKVARRSREAAAREAEERELAEKTATLRRRTGSVVIRPNAAAVPPSEQVSVQVRSIEAHERSVDDQVPLAN